MNVCARIRPHIASHQDAKKGNVPEAILLYPTGDEHSIRRLKFSLSGNRRGDIGFEWIVDMHPAGRGGRGD